MKLFLFSKDRGLRIVESHLGPSGEYSLKETSTDPVQSYIAEDTTPAVLESQPLFGLGRRRSYARIFEDGDAIAPDSKLTTESVAKALPQLRMHAAAHALTTNERRKAGIILPAITKLVGLIDLVMLVVFVLVMVTNGRIKL